MISQDDAAALEALRRARPYRAVIGWYRLAAVAFLGGCLATAVLVPDRAALIALAAGVVLAVVAVLAGSAVFRRHGAAFSRRDGRRAEELSRAILGDLLRRSP